MILHRAAAAALLLLLVDPGVAGAHHYSPLQPGSRFPGEPPSSCTFNFVFRDPAGSRYIGTAGHCVSGVGQTVSAQGAGPIGTVAWMAHSPADFALVRIDPSVHGLVSPAMRHWGGPTGVAPFADVTTGSLYYHFGNGVGFHLTELSKPRAGIVSVTTACRYHAMSPASSSDSGSPTILADGRALGVVTHLGGAGLHSGTRIDCVLEQAAAEGLSITIETAPLVDALQRETTRAQHGLV